MTAALIVVAVVANILAYVKTAVAYAEPLYLKRALERGLRAYPELRTDPEAERYCNNVNRADASMVASIWPVYLLVVGLREWATREVVEQPVHYAEQAARIAVLGQALKEAHANQQALLREALRWKDHARIVEHNAKTDRDKVGYYKYE